MEKRQKENAKLNFINFIQRAWTWEQLTETEKTNFLNLINKYEKYNDIKGTYAERVRFLNSVYESFLIALGYSGFDWKREKDFSIVLENNLVCLKYYNIIIAFIDSKNKLVKCDYKSEELEKFFNISEKDIYNYLNKNNNDYIIIYNI